MSYESEANEIAAALVAKRKAKESQQRISMKTFQPIEDVTKPNLTTDEAAYYLNRQPQTMRVWACLKNGPIQPRKIGGMLAWSTKEVKAIVGV